MTTSPYIHKIIIQKLKIKKQLEGTDLTNIVVSCDWDLHTWHQSHPDIKYGVSNNVEFTLPSEEDETFIPFEQLDEETVIGWIEENVLNLQEIKTTQEQLPGLQFEDEEYDYLINPFSETNTSPPPLEPEPEPEI
jgi:hypothetical protein